MRRRRRPPDRPHVAETTRVSQKTLRRFTQMDNDDKNRPPVQTTDAGIPVESDEYSLTVGPEGPILLQDSYLIEQMANFNRERIAERQPHAKGSGAFCRVGVTNDVKAVTQAAVFQPGTTTRMVARFSTVAGERGSPDMGRAVRGLP